MADDLNPAAVERAAEAAAEHIGWQAGMYDAIRAALAAAGPLVTPDRPGDAVTSDWDTWLAEHDAQVAARALREAAEAIDSDSFEVIGAPREFHQGMQSAVDRLRRRADRIERQEGER